MLPINGMECKNIGPIFFYRILKNIFGVGRKFSFSENTTGSVENDFDTKKLLFEIL